MDFTKREKIILIIFTTVTVLFFSGRYFSNKMNKPQITIKNEEVTENQENGVENGKVDSTVKEKNIAVDVIGEVASPGLVKLKEGARVIDAIEAAGGMLETADRKQVNMARILKDEEQIYVPKQGEEAFVQRAESKLSANSKININRASLSELESLSGIGKSLAGKIIQYRETKGEFKDIKDIMKVSGIGEKKFDAIKDSISVK